MTPTQATLRVAEARITARVTALEARVSAGDDSAWVEYGHLAAALAAIAGQEAPAVHDRLLTTRELAERLRISPKTLLRRRARGDLQAVELGGQRGRAKFRWAAAQ